VTNIRPGFMLLAFFISIATPVIEASKAPYSPEALIASSEFIVVGEILSMEKALMASDVNSGIYLWQVRMSVSKQEKGSLTEKEITTTFNTSDGSTMILCGPSQYPIPAIGDRVKAHLESSAMLKDGRHVYPVLAPNGYTIIEKSSAPAEAVTDTTPLLRKIYYKVLLPMSPALVLLILGYGYYRIRRKTQRLAEDPSAEASSSHEE